MIQGKIFDWPEYEDIMAHYMNRTLHKYGNYQKLMGSTLVNFNLKVGNGLDIIVSVKCEPDMTYSCNKDTYHDFILGFETWYNNKYPSIEEDDRGPKVPKEVKNNMRTFESGAIRSDATGKGRCDLLPFGTLAEFCNFLSDYDWYVADVLSNLEMFRSTGLKKYLHNVLYSFTTCVYPDVFTGMLEVSIHYEEGAVVHGGNNWRKGIPISVYISSGARHLIKHVRGDEDERHDRAFVWNILGALWTLENKPELDDFTIKPETTETEDE